MEIRDRILNAAAAMYAELGYRGATTRRIAEAAGVNELTLFRQFGSKAVLLHEAVCSRGQVEILAPLPEVPGADPRAELRDWLGRQFAELYRHQAMIRTTLGDIEKHPEIAREAHDPLRESLESLGAYVAALARQGRAAPPADARPAAFMLVASVLLDALVRDHATPERFGDSEATLDAYLDVFMHGIRADALTRP